MTYLNIILTINTMLIGIIASGICFIVYHDMTMRKFTPGNCSHDDYCCDNEEVALSDDELVVLTPKMVKCSREFGMCNNG